jgi:hypothetical protein
MNGGAFVDAGTVRVVHGSLDSVDVDVVYLTTTRLPSGAEFSAFCKERPEEDVNVALVEGGVVVDCMRGLPSELNNALVANQRPAMAGQPQLRRVERRSAAEKLLDTLQRSAAMVRRVAEYREEAIAALRTNSAAALLRLALRVDWESEEVTPDADSVKQVAFMAAQAEALLDGVELYDKAGLAARCPALRDCLARRGRAGLGATVRALWRRVEAEARFFQHGEWALSRLPSETALCRFEKNRTRLVGFAAPNARYFRWGSEGAVVGLQPVAWKARPRLPPQQSPTESFDENYELIH